jgi:bifunctional non-homologous end joining protein LigD
MKIEGIVSKLRASPYKPSARNATWQKIKCVLRQEFVIGGYERSVLAVWARCGSDLRRRALLFAGQGRHRLPARGGRAAEEARATGAAGIAVRADRPADRRQDPRRALGRARAGVSRLRSLEWTATRTSATDRSRAMRPDKDPRAVVREIPA